MTFMRVPIAIYLTPIDFDIKILWRGGEQRGFGHLFFRFLQEIQQIKSKKLSVSQPDRHRSSQLFEGDGLTGHINESFQ